jgi:hypothetical protein
VIFFLPAALVILALAGFRRGTLLSLGRIALDATLGLFLLMTAILFLAAAGIGQRAGAGIALLVGERAQHNA